MAGSIVVKPFARTAPMGLNLTAYEPNKQNFPKLAARLSRLAKVEFGDLGDFNS
jgi:hypothetical protein